MISIVVAILAASVFGDGIYHVKNSVPSNVIHTAYAPKQNIKPKDVQIVLDSKPQSVGKAYKEVTLRIVEDKNPNKQVTLFITPDDAKPTQKNTTQTPPPKLRNKPSARIVIPSPTPTRTPTPAPIPSPELSASTSGFRPVPAIVDDTVDDTIDEVAVETTTSQKEDEADLKEEKECLSIAETVAKNPKLSILNQALEASELIDFLSTPSLEATLFAPSDKAMKALSKLLNVPLKEVLSNPALPTIVGYHLVPDLVVFASELQSDQKLATSIKQDVTVGLPPNGDVLITGFEASNIAKVINADITACKSIVHIIDTVLLPDESIDESVY